VLVIAATIWAVLRHRWTAADPAASSKSAAESAALHWVSAATAVTVLTLFALLVSSIFVGRTIGEVPKTEATIVLTAKQWWWQFEYDHLDKSKRFTTANEITIPVGSPVMVRLRSADVIHSFWIPNPHGKRDVIPGREGGIVLTAQRPGVYRGQCAEFCGQQHANMSFWVNAVSKEEYARWLDAQREPSKIPSTPEQRAGQEVFVNRECAICHTIGGTEASGKVAPDLTHFASRRSIAAATLPNRRDALRRWISDPQHVKPGNYMPVAQLQPAEINALTTYLESLK
jgi:cytochrome c oxidase subunit 2